MLTRLFEIQYHILDYIFNCVKIKNFILIKNTTIYMSKHALCKVIKCFQIYAHIAGKRKYT